MSAAFDRHTAHTVWKALDEGSTPSQIEKQGIIEGLSLRVLQRLQTVRLALRRGDLDPTVERRTGWNAETVRVLRRWWNDYVATRSVPTTEAMWDQVERDLWRPEWGDVPLDLYLQQDVERSVVVGGRELRWTVEYDTPEAPFLRLPLPGRGISERQLAYVLGREGAQVFREMAGAWERQLARYLHWARALRQAAEMDGFLPEDQLLDEVQEMARALDQKRQDFRQLFAATASACSSPTPAPA